ncbi:MAG: biopolymer transporter ExbD [Moraxellaceae bacterium]|nr:MAG: biopolymer transporter ExbD [Moraxellaceae bacterium]
MRKLFTRIHQEEESNIDITPMIDVVFIMLIFFIVTASFVKETGIDVNRPQAATAVAKQHANILIAINANDEIWIDKRRVDARSVRGIIARMHAQNPQGSLVIQADKQSTNDKLVKVMDAAREVGIVDIAIATRK